MDIEKPVNRRGIKTCPECGSFHGARTLICSCGYKFIKKTKILKQTERKGVIRVKHPLAEESDACPGLWVYDMPHGMPRITCPGEISDCANKQAVYDYVAYNGLGDSVFSYISSDKISDEELKELWKNATESLKKVWLYLIG
jgi:hypothetical protein